MTSMTPDQGTERKWARPVEEVALAIWRAREERTEPRLRRLQPDDMDMVTGAFALVCADASAAISTFISHGWVNPQFMDALKAEKEGSE